MRDRWMVALLAVALHAGCATVGARSSVLGRPVSVIPSGGGDEVKGELIAVTDETLWIRDESGVREMPTAMVGRVRVQRHSFSGRKAFRWALIGGLISGGGLTAACSSVDGTEGCGTVGLTFLGLWLGVGALAAPSVEASRWLEATPSAEELRRFARFPQGPPENVDLDTMGPPPPKER